MQTIKKISFIIWITLFTLMGIDSYGQKSVTVYIPELGGNYTGQINENGWPDGEGTLIWTSGGKY